MRKTAKNWLNLGVASRVDQSFWGAVRKRITNAMRHRTKWMSEYSAMAKKGDNGWMPTGRRTDWAGYEPSSGHVHFPPKSDPREILGDQTYRLGCVVDEIFIERASYPMGRWDFCAGKEEAIELFALDNPHGGKMTEVDVQNYTTWKEHANNFAWSILETTG